MAEMYEKVKQINKYGGTYTVEVDVDNYEAREFTAEELYYVGIADIDRSAKLAPTVPVVEDKATGSLWIKREFKH